MKPYTDDDIKNALEEIIKGSSIAQTARKYGIPRSTLSGKKRGILPLIHKMGPSTVLTKDEEMILEQWLLHLSDSGFPATKNQLLDSVQHINMELKRDTPFVNGRPGRKWYQSFLKRHPILKHRMSQNLIQPRAKVTEENIKGWFKEVYDHLDRCQNLEILGDSTRVFNMDETAFF